MKQLNGAFIELRNPFSIRNRRAPVGGKIAVFRDTAMHRRTILRSPEHSREPDEALSKASPVMVLSAEQLLSRLRHGA